MSARARLIALGEWLALGAAVGVVCGSASALFLWLLDAVTGWRSADETVIWALPVAGLAIGWVYERFGEPIRGGNNLVIDTIHDDGPELPLRLAPMVMIGTVLTHAFGGSAGREGTAVQMGASLSDWLAHRLRLRAGLRRQLVAAGVAGGFGSVFGTPLAGAVFGLEFVVLGRIEYAALVPALVASLTGDMVTRALGIVHTPYPAVAAVALTIPLLAKWLLFSVAVAATTTVFIELTHAVRRLAGARIPRLPWRMAMGGTLLLLMWQLVGSSDYLGLGVPTIVAAFGDAPIAEGAFALKLLFTVVTIGFGFLGGEVTPLFFVGATLGVTMADVLAIPRDLAAGVGLAAVFAAAANTPLALAIMAAELLGVAVLPHAALVCVLAYLLTGHRGIYPAQRLSRAKSGAVLARETSLREPGS